MKLNCCIIAIQKDEYNVEHWIDYHLNYGFTHIYLIDNNDEKNALKLPIKYKDTVTLFNANGITNIYRTDITGETGVLQSQLYNKIYEEVYKQCKDVYTHVLVIDLDEYFHSDKYNNINDLLSDNINADVLHFLWKNYSDSGYIYKSELPYDNPVDNYTQISPDKPQMNGVRYPISNDGKSIIKFTTETLLGIHNHTFNKHQQNLELVKVNITPDVAVINHYRTQCLEAYIDKIRLRGLYNSKWWYRNGINLAKVYFAYNEITAKKIEAYKKFFNDYGLRISSSDYNFLQKQYLKLTQ